MVRASLCAPSRRHPSDHYGPAATQHLSMATLVRLWLCSCGREIMRHAVLCAMCGWAVTDGADPFLVSD